MPSTQSLFESTDIIHEILLDQISIPDSVLNSSFSKLSEEFDKDSTAQILVISSNNEYVWSCGTRESPVVSGKPINFPGLNLYGKVCYTLYQEIKSAGDNIVPLRNSMATWLSRRQILGHPIKTVFVMADSMCRVIKDIECGMSTTVSGGNFRTVAERAQLDLRQSRLRLEDFTYLIVHVGINELKPWSHKHQQRRSRQIMRDFIHTAVVHGTRPHRILISLPIPHPDIAGLTEFCAWLEDEIENEGYCCLNWRSLPIVPFADGRDINRRLYHRDRFHINHAGFRSLWSQWIEHLPCLVSLSYKLAPDNQFGCGRRRRYNQ